MINNALHAAMAPIVGLALLLPAMVPPVVRAVWWPLSGLRGATGLVARESAPTAVRRTASTAVPVLVTVGFAVLIAGLFQLRATGYALAVVDGGPLVDHGGPVVDLQDPLTVHLPHHDESSAELPDPADLGARPRHPCHRTAPSANPRPSHPAGAARAPG
ncbi:hypothetical protein ACIRST_35495 [Kitasatospora sp. NPDC101447]|uniref:hypothetical protein n=1 Tax=Kitasatospora sp. NPDC101447 TaxID=3364102 RepID=UPI003824E40C